jgi:hypothetical protein
MLGPGVEVGHPVLVVGGALAQDFLAHHRNAEHVTEEVHHLLGPRQGAEVTVIDNAVEAWQVC